MTGHDVRDVTVVTWDSLPTWVKGGSDKSDADLFYAKACVWLKVIDEEVYYAFSPTHGGLIATWGLE